MIAIFLCLVFKLFVFGIQYIPLDLLNNFAVEI